MKKEQCTLGYLYDILCDAQYVANAIKHPTCDEITNIRMKISEDVLKAHSNNIDISYPEDGNIIIHLEHATDEQREEIAIKIADWMQENYPELAMLDMYN